VQGPPRAAARRIAAEVEQILLDERRFTEFVLLEMYYSGQSKSDSRPQSKSDSRELESKLERHCLGAPPPDRPDSQSHGPRLELSKQELDDLLLITGEMGPSCAERLGLATEASPQEMLRVTQERLTYWARVQNGKFESTPRRTFAQIVVDSYRHIENRVHDAVEHRKIAEDLLAYEL
jgi:hypothetical protein